MTATPLALWGAVLLGSAVVFGLKLTGFLLPASVLERPFVMRAAGLVTVALLAALVGIQTLGAAGALVLDARMAGLGVAVVALLLRAPFLVVITVAAAVTAAVRAFG